MVIVIMDLELGLIQIRQLTQANGKMDLKKAKEQRLGQMDISMKVNLVKVNGMVEEL